VLSVVTFALALTVTGILKMLLAALTLTTSYTLIVLLTMLAPGLCRRGSAVWTLGMTKLALVVWLVAPAEWRVVPHPVFFLWAVSLVTFFTVTVLDRRPIAPGSTEPEPPASSVSRHARRPSPS
jgi:SSS family solute:Na+ symporter